jgi:hypothetical protein
MRWEWHGEGCCCLMFVKPSVFSNWKSRLNVFLVVCNRLAHFQQCVRSQVVRILDRGYRHYNASIVSAYERILRK